MFSLKFYKIFYSFPLILVVALVLSLYSVRLWAEEKIEIIQRPLLGNDIPAIKARPSQKKNRERQPLLLPGPDGKLLIKGRKGNAEKGKAVYFKYCTYCHGRHGKGDGMLAIALKPSPSNFIGGNTLDKPDQKLFDTVTYGIKGSYHLDMPAWGPILSVEERLNVIAYIKDMIKKTKIKIKKQVVIEDAK